VGYKIDGQPVGSYTISWDISECASPSVLTNNDALLDSGWSNRLVSVDLRPSGGVTNVAGTNPVVMSVKVGGVTVSEMTVSNGVVVTNYDFRREVLNVGVQAGEVPYVLGGAIAAAGGGGGTGGVVNVGVTVTGAFSANLDWTQGVAYTRSELPAGTNWGWVADAAEAVGVGSESRPGPPAVSGWGGAPPLAITIRPGVVLDVGAGLNDWMTRMGSWVRSLLALLVLVWFGWWVGERVHEDLRFIWIAPQGRTAGQTVMGTGMQAASAIAIASALIGIVGAFAAVVWQWVLQWLGIFEGGSGIGLSLGWLSTLPAVLRMLLDIGPWQTIISCLTLVPGVLAARAWIVSVGSAMVRLLTGL
jgi:hypothetical protein